MKISLELPASLSEQLAAGKAHRKVTPRRSLSVLAQVERDPLAIIDEQNATRIPELVPLRNERMAQSAFAFYRGSAAIMAADLAEEPTTGIMVPSCGDAHVANFGFYASQQRTLVFDLNDFDEAAWAPWEWDLKRLVASVVIAGQSTKRAPEVVRHAILKLVKSYAYSMRRAVETSSLQRYYQHFDARTSGEQMDHTSRKVLKKAITQAVKRTGERAARKLTQPGVDGVLKFVELAPTMVALTPELKSLLDDLIRRYLQTATADINLLLQNYVSVDAIRRVVGVGSVGTRCALTLFQDGDGNTLILQSKEASQSVLERYGRVRQPDSLTELSTARGQGARVVAMQRIMQGVSDPFLGSLRFVATDTQHQEREVELFVRQFHDMKGGIDIETLQDQPFIDYAQACAVTLARAHAQSSNAAEVSGYVGNGKTVGDALHEWAVAYAIRATNDYREFVSTGVVTSPTA